VVVGVALCLPALLAVFPGLWWLFRYYMLHHYVMVWR
jgi:hypothetical protein